MLWWWEGGGGGGGGGGGAEVEVGADSPLLNTQMGGVIPHLHHVQVMLLDRQYVLNLWFVRVGYSFILLLHKELCVDSLEQKNHCTSLRCW